ncbi:riboflavin synthase [Chloroflexota bacterium]
MFTGIVEEIGIVRTISPNTLTTEAVRVLGGVKNGDSIAVNGVCLTVIHFDNRSFTVNLMPETLKRTNLGKLRPGDPVNLERALIFEGRMGGHIVQGHIDTTGKLKSLIPSENAILAHYEAPQQVMKYIVTKGFIAVDGASLTVVDVGSINFSVSLVDITQSTTNLARRKLGDLVNLEVDIIAKYVEKLLGSGKSGINHTFLAEHGFL